MSSKKNIFVPRVNQLDAIHLDHEINRLIRDGILENLQEISNVILDDTNEKMPRITPESVDPAILSCGALSYHRYTRSALLLLKDEPLSQDVPDCIHDKRLKSLLLWKLDQPNYLNKNTGDAGVMDNGNSTGGITNNNSISRANERRHIGSNIDWKRSNNSERNTNSSGTSSSNNQLLQQKNYIDPRSISSSHLMPKFIKRGIVENSQHQSSSSTSSSSININDSNSTNNNNVANINNYGRNNYQQLSSGNNERYNRNDQLQNKRSNTNDKNKLTTAGNNRIVTVSSSSPSNSNINSGYNHHSLTNSTSSDRCVNNKNDQQHQQHHQQNSSTTHSRGGERRIGSGRIPFSSDDWEYRNNDKDNSNNITDSNNDYDNSYDHIAGNIGSSIRNNTNCNNTRYDNRNLSSQQQQQQSEYHNDYHRNDRRPYGRNNDYDNHRNNLDNNLCDSKATIQQQYHQAKRLSDINNPNNSSINNYNNGIINITNDRHHNNTSNNNQHFNNSKTIQQHRINNRHRSNNYSSHNNDEPEWFSCGPTSQHDTIELRGFDENDDIINVGHNNNRNRKNRNDNSVLNTENTKVHQQKQQQQNNNNKKIIDKCNDDVESVCNNVPASPPPARITPTYKLLNNKDNDDNSGDNNYIIDNNDDKKSIINNDGKIQKEFNIDEFLYVDPFNNCFGGEQKTYNIASGGGSSRFKHWFKTGENDNKDVDNGLPKKEINNSRRSSLHEELNSIVSDAGDSTQQINDNDEKNILNKFVPIGIQPQHNSQQSLLEFLQRGNFNNSSNNIGQQLNSPNLSNIGGTSNIQTDRIFQQQQQNGKYGINHYANIDNKQKGLMPSVKELEARMRKDNNESCITQNTSQQQQLPLNQTNNNNVIVQLNAPQLTTVNQISGPTTSSNVVDNNIQNIQPKQDMEAFKRLLERITTKNNSNGVDNLSDCSSSSSTAVNLLNDTIQHRQQENIYHSRQEELKHLIYQQKQIEQHNNFGRQHQQHQIFRANEMLQKSAQSNISREKLSEIIKRPEARALLHGVACGELTQSSLLQLANNGAGGGRYSEVILPILNLLSMPSPLSYINESNHHDQQQSLSPIPIGFNSSIQHGNASGCGVLGQSHSTTGIPQSIPSAHELRAHTQSIMQTALIRKKLEEHEDKYRGHQDIQEKHLQQQQHLTNIQQNHILNQMVNPIEIGIGDFVGNLRNSPTPMMNVGDKPSAAISGSQQQQFRSPTPTSTIAFTPTSVLRKMTAKKDNILSPNSDNSNSSESNKNNNNNYQYVNKIMQNLFMQNGGSGNIQYQQNNTSTSGQPRMILGGGSQHQQHHLQHNTAPVLNAVANNQIIVNKPMGRPILKGPTAVQTTMVPPQMSFASQIEFQQLQQQRNKNVSNPQHQHLLSTQQQSTGENVLINQIQQQQLQQIFQQQRQNAIRAQQQFNPHIVPGNVTNTGLINPVPENDNCNNPANNKIVSETNAQQQQLNTQREGGLSPTSNQLARWFSPELLAQASAGKLPALNMGQALSLEEFERSIQHSSAAAVHN